MSVVYHRYLFLDFRCNGASLGLLFAPKKGDDLRDEIMEYLKEKGVNLKKSKLDKLVDELQECNFIYKHLQLFLLGAFAHTIFVKKLTDLSAEFLPARNCYSAYAGFTLIM